MSRRLIVSHFFPPTLGGIADVAHAMAMAAPQDTVVVAPPHDQASEFDRQQPYICIRAPLFSTGKIPSWWPTGALLRDIVERERIESVLFAHYAPYAWFGSQLKKKFGVRWGIYLHGLDALAYTAGLARRALVRQSLNRADFVLANSAWTRQQLANDISPWRVGVLHPAVEVPALHTPTPVNHQLLSLGRLTSIKGYDVAIRAVAQLAGDYPDVRYTVAGEGEERTTLESLAQTLGVTQHIQFIGAQTPAERRGLYNDASVVLQPSRSRLRSHFVQAESFGLVAAQAGAHSRPVIASAVGGVSEVVQHGVTGLLVPPDDETALANAIRWYWENSATAAAHGAAARQHVTTQFSSAHFVSALNQQLTARDVWPKISVCIPVWNSSATIEATLDSLLAQDYPNLEWIVVDDGSTDRTPEIVRQYSQVRLMTTSHGGAAQARNVAAEAATGEYLYFSDADCIHVPQALSTLFRALENHPEAAFAYSSFTLGRKKFRLRSFSPTALKKQNYISTRALLRRTAFLGYDPAIRRLQDWDLWLRSAAQGLNGIWVNQVLYRSVVQARTMSSGWFPKFLYRWPKIADRLSRGAGMSLREAEAIVRRKHGLETDPSTPWPSFVCPVDHTPLRSRGEALYCTACATEFPNHHAIAELLHPQLLDEFKRTEIHAHSDVLAWRADRVAPRNSWYHRRAKKPLQQLSGSQLFLEVAAGERPDSLELVQAGHRAIITDIAEERVHRAQQSAAQLGILNRTRWAVADGEHLPLPDASVDGVLTAASFHHFPVPSRALTEFRRVTKPGGYIVFELEPQRWPYRTVFRVLAPVRKLLRRREAAGHVHSVGDDTTEGFTRAQLEALARDTGLEIVRLEPAKIVTEFADQTARMIGKFRGRQSEAPRWLQAVLDPLDAVLTRVPAIRRAAWHWNVIFRVP